ncbi:hypothetical protein DRE_02295 [Drechslerella stenobrocha 248]|uniref:Uncharacterized protein n=1 Tax=Drechslerella stenobrocha 248 TaxID=1043628 RepID=W7HVI5_9PEZI|nr:hypothetical protein DRE_02295 [Drechslerella stenobrocha 248]
MSLCSRAVLQAGRRPTTFSKPTYLYLKRQLATEAEAQAPSFDEPPPPPPSSVGGDAAPADAAAPTTPASPRRSRRMKSKYTDGKIHTIETMPYRCYQAALKIIQEDRVQKLARAEAELRSIEMLKKHRGYAEDNPRIKRMEAYAAELLLNVDKNNPRLKYNYDNKLQRDPHRLIYQHWDDKAWRSMKRKVLMQRIRQMFIVPDVLPAVNPIVEVRMKFSRTTIEPGVKVLARKSMHNPSVKVVPFDSKERLVTVVVVDPDRPNETKDGFDFYLQWMVTNCPVSIESPMAIGRSTRYGGRDEVAPYEAPYVYKGENYHRYCVFILEQDGRLEVGKKDAPASDAKKPSAPEASKPQEPAQEAKTDATSEASAQPNADETPELEKKETGPVTEKAPEGSQEARIERLGFNLRSFIDRNNLTVIGAHLWRCEFDESMMDVMKKLGRQDWKMKYVRHPEFI